METSELLKQAQTDLAFALAQGDAAAEDAAAAQIAELEARCPICHARGEHSLSCPTRWHS